MKKSCLALVMFLALSSTLSLTCCKDDETKYELVTTADYHTSTEFGLGLPTHYQLRKPTKTTSQKTWTFCKYAGTSILIAGMSTAFVLFGLKVTQDLEEIKDYIHSDAHEAHVIYNVTTLAEHCEPSAVEQFLDAVVNLGHNCH